MLEIQNYKEVESILEKSDYDYIAFATSPWHAYSISAAILCLQNMNDCLLRGIIFIIKNKNESYLIDDDYFAAIDAKCYRYNPNHSMKDMLSQEIISTYYCFTRQKKQIVSKSNIYVLSQQKPYVLWLAILNKVNKEKKVNSVVCDEGAGSYINSAKDRLNIGKLNNKSLLKYLKSIYDEYVLIPTTINKLTSSNSLFDMCLFEKKHNKVKIKESMAMYYKKAMETHLQYIEFSVPTIDHKYVLVNTQPTSRDEIRNEMEIDVLWEEVINLYTNNGYKVLVKPHPREKDNLKYIKMGAEVIDEKHIAQELLLMKMRAPFVLISIFSTTLLTTPIFNDIHTVCLAPIVRNMKSISNDYRDELDRFIDTFDNITQMVSALDELPL